MAKEADAENQIREQVIAIATILQAALRPQKTRNRKPETGNQKPWMRACSAQKGTALLGQFNLVVVHCQSRRHFGCGVAPAIEHCLHHESRLLGGERTVLMPARFRMPWSRLATRGNEVIAILNRPTASV
jgi:hypothetical protein